MFAPLPTSTKQRSHFPQSPARPAPLALPDPPGDFLRKGGPLDLTPKGRDHGSPPPCWTTGLHCSRAGGGFWLFPFGRRPMGDLPMGAFLAVSSDNRRFPRAQSNSAGSRRILGSGLEGSGFSSKRPGGLRWRGHDA